MSSARARVAVLVGHCQPLRDDAFAACCCSSSGCASASAVVESAPTAGVSDVDRDVEEARMYPSGQQGMYRADLQVPMDKTKIRLREVYNYHVPHLRNYMDLTYYKNGFVRSVWSSCPGGNAGVMHRSQLIHEDEVILAGIARRGKSETAKSFTRAGMREYVVWGPGEVKAAVVTCGGLCPGLNDVVSEIVRTLFYNYGVDKVYGIRDGYRGFYEDKYRPWRPLTPDDISAIHLEGGTFLGSSRGGFQLDKICDSIEEHGVNQVYIIGGDGTHRAADLVCQEMVRRGRKVAVAGVPKTIDNDIGVIDRSFGFNTAVEEAQRAIVSARVEASCTPNGIGIVKLMGRASGMIAANATIASRQVDLCLIPEISIDIPSVLSHLELVIQCKGHAVVVVAEGAGAKLIVGDKAETDESGNPRFKEIGLFLKDKINDHFNKLGIPFSIKYHDPSYMIRSVPANASDSIFAMTIAQNAVHGCMAGYTGFTSAMVNNRTVYLPISLITSTSPTSLNPNGRTWERVISSTHQPDFEDKSAQQAKS